MNKQLEIGRMYIIQYFDVAFIGRLTYETRRYSQNFVTKTEKDPKGKLKEVTSLELAKPHYRVLCFKAEFQENAEKRGVLKRQFEGACNEEQCYFTNALVLDENIFEIPAYDWMLSKMINVHGSNVSELNVIVNKKIVETSLRKANELTDFSINYLLNYLDRLSREIADSSQLNWESTMSFFENQMPM